ncbi:uroporphyrinogen-III synthase [Cryobacterium breve]|uniref:uroporphyrinogen-III synthase n=1 Tax=Cryobacterium breve TaxID=1259258 RepID=UPI00248BB651|nr:uroporphyrinogen-III synthase [Cryobacterium breve]
MTGDIRPASPSHLPAATCHLPPPNEPETPSTTRAPKQVSPGSAQTSSRASASPSRAIGAPRTSSPPSERRGAEVVHAPAIRIAAAADDARITSDTLAIISARPDILLATTSYGIRRWFEAADAAGVGHELTETLEHSSILVRGPKARGAVRAAGLDDDGMSDEETTKSLVDYVLRDGAAGKTVAVQLHGFTDQPQLERLVAAGATVLTVAPYRWLLPEDSARVLRLVDLICAGGVDAVTFTSAPAVMALFGVADSIGRLEEPAGRVQ